MLESAVTVHNGKSEESFLEAVLKKAIQLSVRGLIVTKNSMTRKDGKKMSF